MNGWTRFLPFTDLRGYSGRDVARDLAAAGTLTFMSIPQGVAYAMIAGLPPAMGLYAGCIPTIIGSFFRSSRHVITGPTNALSLLVGTAGAASAGLDPVPTALLLAFLVGAVQLGAGVLRLGVLVDYISIPVVMGYITGAGILIGAGQLPNFTETQPGPGPLAGTFLERSLFDKVAAWGATVPEANVWAIAVGLVTLIGIVLFKRLDRRIPGAMIVLAVMTLGAFLLGAESYGLRRIMDLSPVPAGFPPLSVPFGGGDYAWSFDGWLGLFPIAIAGTVLSLVESSAVGRAISAKSGQRLDLSVEFAGQGLANIAAAFFGAYPTSGSLSRSALNHQSDAASRLAGVYNGLMMLVVLLALGPAVNYTPIAALAGLLLIVAYDLVDTKRIRKILKGRRSDAAAFLVTVMGTWILRLDYAIYVGVVVSLFLFLRTARLLTIHELVFDDEGRPMELREDDPVLEARRCRSVRMLQVEGQLFFGASGELASALDKAIADESAQLVWLRIRRAFGMDISIAQVLEAAAERLRAEGRHFLVIGVRAPALEVLERTGAMDAIGPDNVFPREGEWFAATDKGLLRALGLIGPHACEAGCPIERHLRTRDVTPPLIHGEGPHLAS
jgi:SulP family sulfate permease